MQREHKNNMNELYSESLFEDQEDRFQITNETENAYKEIDSLEELLYRLDRQFEEDTRLGVDRTDYFKIYLLKFMGIKENDFPEKWYEYLDDDNREEFLYVLEQFSKRLYQYYSININTDSDNVVEIIYAIYLLFVVRPEQFIVDYLLYNHFYVDDKNFANWFQQQKINEKIILDLFDDPVAQNEKTQKLIKSITNKDLIKLDYKDRITFFTQYAKDILTDLNTFIGEELFQKLNTFNPNQNYDFLDNCSRVFFDLSIEDEELLIDKLIDRTFNVDYLLPYLNEKIITPFFKYLDQMVAKETQAIANSFISK